jgi:hypothetical protein
MRVVFPDLDFPTMDIMGGMLFPLDSSILQYVKLPAAGSGYQFLNRIGLHLLLAVPELQPKPPKKYCQGKPGVKPVKPRIHGLALTPFFDKQIVSKPLLGF